MDPVTLFMALAYFVIGAVCIQNPARLLGWVSDTLKRMGNDKVQTPLNGRGIVFFVRLIGFLALLNAGMLFYSAHYRR